MNHRLLRPSVKERRMSALYWDNGNSKGGNDGFGVINHATGKFIGTGEQTVRAMVDSWENTDPNYTLKAVYDTAPESSRKGQSGHSQEGHYN